VVPDVPEAAHPDAAGDVGGLPAGEHRDDEPVRSPLGDPRQPPEGAPAERLDPGAHRLHLDRGQRSVEVRHDEQRRGGGHKLLEALP
jgi:hypothetical protein